MLKAILVIAAVIAVLAAVVMSVLLCVAETHISEEDNDDNER